MINVWKYWETWNFKEQRIFTATASFNPFMEIFYFFQRKSIKQYIILSVNKVLRLDFLVDRVKWFVTWSGKATSILVDSRK